MSSVITVPRMSGARRCVRRRRHDVEIAEQTGPLDMLAGQRVLCVADAQNWDLSARDLGYKLSWQLLGRTLSAAAAQAHLHAVFSRREGDQRRWDYFQQRNWTPHAKTTRMVRRMGGMQADANADNHVSFMVGLLACFMAIDVVVIGTGDGQLAEDVAESVSQLPRPRRCCTLSLAGSTAARLNSQTCRLIEANLEIGRDCLRPVGSRDCGCPLRGVR